MSGSGARYTPRGTGHEDPTRGDRTGPRRTDTGDCGADTLVNPARIVPFGSAAARVYVTQPAFSQQIRFLEQRLGVVLVERGGRNVRFTAVGQSITEEGRAVVDAMTRLRQTADRHVGAARGPGHSR
jgi:hypothetical protein